MFIIYNFEFHAMTEVELAKIKSYLNKTFKTENFLVKKRKSIDDSCEIYFEDEFIGLIYKEMEEGEQDYQFHMTILNEDLKDF
ncbi:MAG: DUF3126 family protein [Pseudomonadota bacterium]|nr:DUF3126 family protein [Pseudomonadota bacterium]